MKTRGFLPGLYDVHLMRAGAGHALCVLGRAGEPVKGAVLSVGLRSVLTPANEWNWATEMLQTGERTLSSSGNMCFTTHAYCTERERYPKCYSSRYSVLRSEFCQTC